MSTLRGLLCLLVCGLGCSGGTGLPEEPTPDAPPPMSQFSVAWTLVSGTTTVTCDQARALVVSVEVTSPNLGSGFVEAFSCGNGSGTSRKVAPGTYDLAFELIGSGGSLGTLPSQRLQLRGGEVQAAAALRFPVPAPTLR